MLDKLVLQYRSGQNLKYTGIDSLEKCRNELYFNNYPYEISYDYNSRGFRDEEWPEDLENCIWCFGDSFTVGLGSPYNHIWPKVLEKHSGIRTINISMDGASNQWISRKCIDLLSVVRPKAIVVMWSFTNRREDANESLPDEDRRIWLEHNSTEQKDTEHFFECRKKITDNIGDTPYVDFMIPNHARFDRLLSLDFRFLGSVKQLDYSRDHYHFDQLTSEAIAKKIIINLNL